MELHYCYLLQSCNPQYHNRTYFGYTIDPKRRLRQHNGEIQGGAKKTQKARPWKMLLYIEGFTSHRMALQFEWAVNHPRIRRNYVSGRLKTIEDVLSRKRWTSQSPLSKDIPLIITWIDRNLYLCTIPTQCSEMWIWTYYHLKSDSSIVNR